MNKGFTRLDPKWNEFAASLREGKLYVKMPIAKARALGMVWEVLRQKDDSGEHADQIEEMLALLLDEAIESSTYGISSVFYMVPEDQGKEDLKAVSGVAGKDASGVFQLFQEALEKGLAADLSVDWIERVGGPRAPSAETSEIDISFESLPLEITIL